MHQKKRGSRISESSIYGNPGKFKLPLGPSGKILEVSSCTRSCAAGQGSSYLSTDYSDHNQISSTELNHKLQEQTYSDSGKEIFIEIKDQIIGINVSDPLKFDRSCEELAKVHHINEPLILSVKIVIVKELIKKNCVFESTFKQLMRQYVDHRPISELHNLISGSTTKLWRKLKRQLICEHVLRIYYKDSKIIHAFAIQSQISTSIDQFNIVEENLKESLKSRLFNHIIQSTC